MPLVLDDLSDPSNAVTLPRTLQDPPTFGKVLDDRFLLGAEIGRGGAGVVFAATDKGRDREVAIKLVPFHDSAQLSRLRREGAVLAELVGPHFVTVYETGVLPPYAYVVMERLHGEDLRTRLERTGLPGREQVVEISRELSLALWFAHDLGYVHRDLKPANVFLENHRGRDRVKVLDFGLAKHLTDDIRVTTTGVLLGSPSFMAPEQIERPRDADHRADLWSYAVMLYRLLVGVPPFEGSGGRLLASIQCSEHRLVTRIDPSLPKGVEAFFERGLAKRPDERFQSATEMHAAFVSALG